MAEEVKFPDVGEGITEGELVKWLVKEGEEIKADQALAEIETDKAIVEIPSPKAGTVLKLYGKEGDTIKVGSVLAVLGKPGEKPPAIPVPPPAAPARPEEKPPEIPEEALAPAAPIPKEKPPETPKRVLATPSTRKLARELGVEISEVVGTGPGERITDEDVKRFAEAKKAPPKPPERPALMPPEKPLEERIPLHGIRKTIAENMVKSKFTAPHVVHMDEADVTLLVEMREREKKIAEEKGVKLTYLPFIVKATVAALKQHPYFNASLEDMKEIVLKKYYNIGIAVDTPDGLMVPVIKNADSKSILEIAKEIETLSEEARTRKIKLQSLKGGTFTITNIGALGGLFSTPIINPPEVAILAVHKIKDMPVVKDGEVKIRKILNLSLSFDHRIIDGAQAARFMNFIIKHLESPDLLLLDVV